MLRKKETMTIITPIPGFIPRQLAIDILHSHSEVITLNPLVLDHKPIPAPRNAAADEYYSTWYEITERIQYVPGMGKMGSGKISFNGCFHDMPWGLQTHIYAPMNIDMRNRYRVQGNQPGIEAPEAPEIGLEELGAPKDGLYLREDIEIKCNITMISFVKAEMKKASKEMVGRMIKKAELLDAGILKAMFQDGKLKTINLADRTNTTAQDFLRRPTMPPDALSPGGVPPGSPGLMYQQPQQSPQYAQFAQPNAQYPQNPYQVQQTPPPQNPYGPPVPPKTQQTIAMELPGDYYHAAASRSPSLHQAQPSPGYAPNGYRHSSQSQPSDPRWSHPQPSPGLSDSQRASMYSVASTPPPLGYPNAGVGQQTFAAELSAHNETAEERKY
ncbi:hypothetical protein EDB81DRAFT_92890 [Dactylonectria macrodidyma]|uniref:DUF7053 domain-containing protein n=1 Tax=Dactylonectria macrodidyma TaxID=307937 RepID=A0A9P9IXF9_9HYPO|nr:hypothetical protein EDB81DRAFT_92890 [Dactylonectria macrodidyma]